MKIIDGHAMIGRVESLYKKGAVDLSYYNIVKEAVQMENIVDAAPVIHGTWEPSPDYPGYHRCSVCKDCYIDPAWLADGKWSFCPNCGARNSTQKRSDTP